jgi:hypothetical protein
MRARAGLRYLPDEALASVSNRRGLRHQAAMHVQRVCAGNLRKNGKPKRRPQGGVVRANDMLKAGHTAGTSRHLKRWSGDHRTSWRTTKIFCCAWRADGAHV